jgi:hypothetical protein
VLDLRALDVGDRADDQDPRITARDLVVLTNVDERATCVVVRVRHREVHRREAGPDDAFVVPAEEEGAAVDDDRAVMKCLGLRADLFGRTHVTSGNGTRRAHSMPPVRTMVM